MSLTYFLWNGLEVNPDYYQCPTEPKSAEIRRELWGAYFFWSGILILTLYLTCFIAIASHELMKTPAYKAMFVLGIFDLLSVCIDSIATGILGFAGVSYCDFPRLIFILGAIGYGSWMGCCITSLNLAVIRICDVCDLKIHKLFEGFRIYFSLFFCCSYGFYGIFLTKPLIFSSAYMSWFFDPGLGKDPSLYINVAQIFNNFSMAIGTVTLNGYLAYLFIKKPGSNSNEFSKYKINVLLQAFLFCIFHFICALMYTYMQYVAAPEVLILVAQVTWQWGTGSICIVYLTLNRSIQKAVLHMIIPKINIKVSQIPNVPSSDSRALGMQNNVI
ncbi:hypothetical protein B9Z55_017470 [Caenorhabditis nigoni]|nr:hypothetical protein B9Z55_017470 [Caenorhabditis nigoni]